MRGEVKRLQRVADLDESLAGDAEAVDLQSAVGVHDTEDRVMLPSGRRARGGGGFLLIVPEGLVPITAG